MANLYIIYKNYTTKKIVKDQYKIIAETEFHWTIRYRKENVRTIDKARPCAFLPTPEQAYEFYYNSIDHNIGRCLEMREGYINELRDLEEAKESLLKE